jgi:chromosome segregation ATPase
MAYNLHCKIGKHDYTFHAKGKHMSGEDIHVGQRAVIQTDQLSEPVCNRRISPTSRGLNEAQQNNVSERSLASFNATVSKAVVSKTTDANGGRPGQALAAFWAKVIDFLDGLISRGSDTKAVYQIRDAIQSENPRKLGELLASNSKIKDLLSARIANFDYVEMTALIRGADRSGICRIIKGIIPEETINECCQRHTEALISELQLNEMLSVEGTGNPARELDARMVNINNAAETLSREESVLGEMDRAVSAARLEYSSAEEQSIALRQDLDATRRDIEAKRQEISGVYPGITDLDGKIEEETTKATTLGDQIDENNKKLNRLRQTIEGKRKELEEYRNIDKSVEAALQKVKGLKSTGAAKCLQLNAKQERLGEVRGEMELNFAQISALSELIEAANALENLKKGNKPQEEIDAKSVEIKTLKNKLDEAMGQAGPFSLFEKLSEKSPDKQFHAIDEITRKNLLKQAEMSQLEGEIENLLSDLHELLERDDPEIATFVSSYEVQQHAQSDVNKLTSDVADLEEQHRRMELEQTDLLEQLDGLNGNLQTLSMAWQTIAALKEEETSKLELLQEKNTIIVAKNEELTKAERALEVQRGKVNAAKTALEQAKIGAVSEKYSAECEAFFSSPMMQLENADSLFRDVNTPRSVRQNGQPPSNDELKRAEALAIHFEMISRSNSAVQMLAQNVAKCKYMGKFIAKIGAWIGLGEERHTPQSNDVAGYFYLHIAKAICEEHGQPSASDNRSSDELRNMAENPNSFDEGFIQKNRKIIDAFRDVFFLQMERDEGVDCQTLTNDHLSYVSMNNMGPIMARAYQEANELQIQKQMPPMAY